jgi:GTP cyclohydrolase III
MAKVVIARVKIMLRKTRANESVDSPRLGIIEGGCVFISLLSFENGLSIYMGGDNTLSCPTHEIT